VGETKSFIHDLSGDSLILKGGGLHIKTEREKKKRFGGKRKGGVIRPLRNLFNSREPRGQYLPPGQENERTKSKTVNGEGGGSLYRKIITKEGAGRRAG